MEELIYRKETKQLKGLAIAMIIIQHIGQTYNLSVVNPLGPLGVFLFLFLSGYGLYSSYQAKGRRYYFRKRLLKVYIPYLATVLLFVGISIIIENQFLFSDVIKYMLLLKLPQGSYWFLILMFYWYIVFYFIAPIIDKPKFSVPILFATSVFIIALVGFSVGFIWQLFSFPMGVLVACYKDKANSIICAIRKPVNGIVLLLIAFVCVIVKKTPYVESRKLGFLDTLMQMGITYSLGILLIGYKDLIKKNGIIDRVTLFIGSISYELYLAHALPLDYLKVNNSIKYFEIYTLLVIAVTIILYIITRYMEKIIKSSYK